MIKVERFRVGDLVWQGYIKEWPAELIQYDMIIRSVRLTEYRDSYFIIFFNSQEKWLNEFWEKNDPGIQHYSFTMEDTLQFLYWERIIKQALIP